MKIDSLFHNRDSAAACCDYYLSCICLLYTSFLVAIIRSAHDKSGSFKILNAICRVYLTVIRGTPTMIQLLIMNFVIFGAVSINKIIVGGLAFGINSGAYVAEICLLYTSRCV